LKLKCITVDDEFVSLRVIRQLVNRCDFLELIAECNSAKKATEVMEEHDVDLIFLDVEMPEMTGIELMGVVKNLPMVILVTGKKEYAADAFDYDVIDYLVKPVLYQRFLKAAERAKKAHSKYLNEKEKDASNYIYVKSNSVWTKIDVDTIHYVKAMSDYVGIFVLEESELKRYVIHSTMKSVINKLDPDKFIRVHRSYIININKIRSFDGDQVFVKDVGIPVGITHRKEVALMVQKLSG
jgi:DNA-binding LytR/AlgR family response regulator